MTPIIAFNTISKQFTKHRNALMKLQYDINAGAAATVYVQVFDFPSPADLAAGKTVPDNGSVPIESWPTPAGATNGYKEFKRGELSLNNGLFVCVSTTQATLTIGTGNNKFDSVSAELWDPLVVNMSETQNTDIGVNIWGNGVFHSIFRIAATNLEAGVRYLQLFVVGASDLPEPGDVPVTEWTLAANGDSGGKDTVLASFASTLSGPGFVPFGKTASHVTINGCAVMMSTTPGKYTAPAGAGMNVYVEYL